MFCPQNISLGYLQCYAKPVSMANVLVPLVDDTSPRLSDMSIPAPYNIWNSQSPMFLDFELGQCRAFVNILHL